MARQDGGDGDRPAWATALAAALAAGLAGCGGEDAVEVGTVIVGVTSELRPSVDFQSLRATLRDDEAGSRVVARDGGTPEPLGFPLELPFTDRPAGTAIDVVVEAFRDGRAEPLVRRTAGTTVRAGAELLLPLRLEAACAGSRAPACADGETCVGGSCAASFVAPEALDPYDPGWGTPVDRCKAEGDAPEVIVGQGQGDYLPIDDGEVAQIEAGPQGGHHVWIAGRVRGLAQSGSITRVTGRVPGLAADVPPLQLIFTFEPGEGAYCEFYGFRFQLDDPLDVDDLFGQELELEVRVTDPAGAVGTGRRTVTLSNDTL